MKRISAVCTGVIILAGCNRTVPCHNQYITPAFIGFNMSDLDSIIVRQYKKGDNFLTLIDTALLTYDTSFLKYASSHDTTLVSLNYISGREKYTFPDHDWQIYIPAVKKTVLITNITSPQTDQTCFLGGDLCPDCLNQIDSFLQNGQRVIPQYGKLLYTGGDFYLTYIHR